MPTARLNAISKASDELDRCIRGRGSYNNLDEGFLWTLGELDWITELHRLIYEGTNENL